MTLQLEGVRPEIDGIQEAYFEWMLRLACEGRTGTWRKLFRRLHQTEFTYILPMDANRADDGIDLRHRFAWEFGLDREQVDEMLYGRPCSVLEMMMALGLRCEEDITQDPDRGCRIGEWIFAMLESLGLGGMDDDHYQQSTVDHILRTFLNREYQPNGRGGLFTVNNGRDLRRAEIWYQMMWWLSNVYGV